MDAEMLPLFATSFPFSKDESTQWVVLAAGVLATLYVIMRSKSRAKRVDPLARQSGGIGLSQQRQIERDINHLMVEMLDTARQMTAQLDTRAARLEVLMKEADARLAALKAATGSTAAGATFTSSAPPASTPTAAPLPPVPSPPETPPDPRHAEVYLMADQGRSPQEIARKLNRPNGEVELILALRPQ